MGSYEEVSQLIAEFMECQDFGKLEELADKLGEARDSRAIEPLLSRLGGDRVQEDRDVEDAVCGAFVKLGVMKQIGNLSFRFLDDALLPEGVDSLLEKYRPWIPSRYMH